MDTARLDQTVQGLAQATGRRGAMRSLGVRGLALLAALGLGEVSAKSSHKGGEARFQADGKGKKKRKTKRGPAGPAGPPGLAEFTTRIVTSANSADLGTSVGDRVVAVAECGGEGKVVSCGYAIVGVSAGSLVNAIVSVVAPEPTRSKCSAFLLRTADGGSTPDASIQAIAICLA
jgi:hypothetical protein